MRLTAEQPGTLPIHAQAAADVVAGLGTDAARGLGREEAARRLNEAGPNELPGARATPAWRILASQFKNILIVILLIAIVLSLALGHVVEAAAIAAIAIFSVVLGFIQEFRAERALEALRGMTAPRATVIRDGQEQEVAAREVVTGDIVALSAGDLVPADARLVESFNLRIDEAALTGESSPVGKSVEPLPANVPLADRRNLVFSSTAVTYGRGRAVVIATGRGTQIGEISRLLASVQPAKTPLEQNLDRVGAWLARAALAVVAVVVALGLLRGLPAIEMLIFGIALAVAVVPEALPAVVTISLAIGAQRMARRHALIRRLPAVETLGSTTVICSDKTGTLTTGEMTVREVRVAGEVFGVSGAGYDPRGEFQSGGRPAAPDEALKELLTAAVLCTDAQLVQGEAGRWRVRGDPTEGALIVAASKAGLRKAELEAALRRVEEIPFSSERKRMTTLHARRGGTVAFSKGAPETILAACSGLRTRDGQVALDDGARERILAAAKEMAGRALRVLAVSSREDAALETAEREATFLGLVGMIDVPRPEAQAAVRTCHEAGIRPVMITGDHPLTARAVAEELDMLRHGEVMSGAELADVGDEELRRRAETVDAYARVSPADKLRIVAALQSRNEIVAMTGDGVNDAPALRKADIGIAMGVNGTDVAKEASAMTLADDNFASIVAAVEEGRAIFDNIKKYLMYLLSSNVGEIGLMAAAMILGLPLPLTAVQILYVNLATDGLPALALAVDPQAGDLMRRRPHRPGAGIFSRPVVVLMLLGGFWSTVVNVSLFAWALASGLAVAEAMTMTFVSLVLIQFFKAYSFRSERHSILVGPFRNRWLNRAVLWELGLLAAIVYLPALQSPFGTFPLPAVDWLILVGAAFTIVPVLEAAKWMERRGWFGPVE